MSFLSFLKIMKMNVVVAAVDLVLR